MVSVSPAARLVYDVSSSDLTLTGISIAHRSLTQHQPRHHCTRHREYFRPFPKCQLSHKHVAPSLPRHTPLRQPLSSVGEAPGAARTLDTADR